jgi:hypothetical protein
MTEENFDIEQYTAPPYSSGESDFSAEQDYLEMTSDQQAEHIEYLWERARAKLIGAVKVINTFGDINRRIYLYGKKAGGQQDKLEEERKAKKNCLVIMPRDKFMTMWNIMILFPLLYTATVMPVRISYIEGDIQWI